LGNICVNYRLILFACIILSQRVRKQHSRHDPQRLPIIIRTGHAPSQVCGRQLGPVPHRCGTRSAFAALAAGLIGTMALPGRLFFTPLGDRLPCHQVTASRFLLQTGALLVLLQFHSLIGVYAIVILYGIGFGAISLGRASGGCLLAGAPFGCWSERRPQSILF